MHTEYSTAGHSPGQYNPEENSFPENSKSSIFKGFNSSLKRRSWGSNDNLSSGLNRSWSTDVSSSAVHSVTMSLDPPCRTLSISTSSRELSGNAICPMTAEMDSSRLILKKKLRSTDSQQYDSPIKSRYTINILDPAFSPRFPVPFPSPGSPWSPRSPCSPRSPLEAVTLDSESSDTQIDSDSMESASIENSDIEKTYALKEEFNQWLKKFNKDSIYDVACLELAISLLILNKIEDFLQKKDTGFFMDCSLDTIDKCADKIVATVIHEIIYTDLLIKPILDRLETLQDVLNSPVPENALSQIRTISREELQSYVTSVYASTSSDSDTSSENMSSSDCITDSIDLITFCNNIQNPLLNKSKFAVNIKQAIHPDQQIVEEILEYFNGWIQVKEGSGHYQKLLKTVREKCIEYVGTRKIGKTCYLLSGSSEKQPYLPLQCICWDKAFEQFANIGPNMLIRFYSNHTNKSEQQGILQTPRNAILTPRNSLQSPRALNSPRNIVNPASGAMHSPRSPFHRQCSAQTPQQQNCERACEVFKSLLGTKWGETYTKDLQSDCASFYTLASDYLKYHILMLHPEHSTKAFEELLCIPNSAVDINECSFNELFLNPLKLLDYVKKLSTIIKRKEHKYKIASVEKFYNVLKNILKLSDTDQKILAQSVGNFIGIILMCSHSARQLGEEQMLRRFPDLFEKYHFKRETQALPELKLLAESPHYIVEYSCQIQNKDESLLPSQVRQINYTWSLQSKASLDSSAKELRWQGRLHIPHASELATQAEEDPLICWNIDNVLANPNILKSCIHPIEETP